MFLLIRYHFPKWKSQGTSAVANFHWSDDIIHNCCCALSDPSLPQGWLHKTWPIIHRAAGRDPWGFPGQRSGGWWRSQLPGPDLVNTLSLPGPLGVHRDSGLRETWGMMVEFHQRSVHIFRVVSYERHHISIQWQFDYLFNRLFSWEYQRKYQSSVLLAGPL